MNLFPPVDVVPTARSQRLGKAVRLGVWPSGSPEWHAARQGRIGGSEAAIAAGFSPYASPLELYLRKRNRIADYLQSDALEWGHRLEPAVAQKFADNHPEMLLQRVGTFVSRDRPWQSANPDRVLVGPGVDGVEGLECKTSDSHNEDKWGLSGPAVPGLDLFPQHYLIQCLWYMDVLGADRWHLAVLVGTSDYREYVINAADYADDIVFLRATGLQFLLDVADGNQPAYDGMEGAYRAMLASYDRFDEKVETVLPADVVRRYIRSQVLEKLAQRDSLAARQEMAQLLGETGARYGIEARSADLPKTVPSTRIMTRVAKKDGTFYLTPHKTTTARVAAQLEQKASL